VSYGGFADDLALVLKLVKKSHDFCLLETDGSPSAKL